MIQMSIIPPPDYQGIHSFIVLLLSFSHSYSHFIHFSFSLLLAFPFPPLFHFPFPIFIRTTFCFETAFWMAVKLFRVIFNSFLLSPPLRVYVCIVIHFGTFMVDAVNDWSSHFLAGIQVKDCRQFGASVGTTVEIEVIMELGGVHCET